MLLFFLCFYFLTVFLCLCSVRSTPPLFLWILYGQSAKWAAVRSVDNASAMCGSDASICCVFVNRNCRWVVVGIWRKSHPWWWMPGSCWLPCDGISMFMMLALPADARITRVLMLVGQIVVDVDSFLPMISAVLLAAKCCFDVREYRRCAWLLRNASCKRAVFLRCYSTYLTLRQVCC